MTRGATRTPDGLARVTGCLGRRADVPCVPVEGGAVTCPRCGRQTPVGERLIGPRVPLCECYEALCAHFALVRVVTWRTAARR